MRRFQYLGIVALLLSGLAAWASIPPDIDSLPVPSAFSYTADGGRVARTTNDTTAVHLLDHGAALPNVLVELDTNGAPVRFYLWAGGLLAQVDTNGVAFYCHPDRQGSTLALSDTNGVPTDQWFYSPYGEVLNRSGSTRAPYAWLGGYGVWTEGNGLYHMKARYYHAGLRRFITADPIGLAGGANFYGYAYDNPLFWMDVLGLCAAQSSSDRFMMAGEHLVDWWYRISRENQAAEARWQTRYQEWFWEPGRGERFYYFHSPEFRRGRDATITALLLGIGVAKPYIARLRAKPALKYHYTTAEEASFHKPTGLWKGSSVTDKLYTNPLKASQELGIPVPNKVIPIRDVGQFVPNKPPIVQRSFRFTGGGTDFINLEAVPPSQLLPAQPLGPR